MKRLTVLVVVLLLAATGAWAQQSSGQAQEQPKPEAKPKPKPANPADIETLTGRPYPGVMEPAPKPGHPLNGVPAPKKGHPLDWRDVDILTGKAERAERDARRPSAGYAPYAYGGVPAYRGRYGAGYSALASEESQFAPVTTRTSPFFAPRFFGRGHGRSSFFFGSSGARPFFFGHGGGRHSTLFLIP